MYVRGSVEVSRRITSTRSASIRFRFRTSRCSKIVGKVINDLELGDCGSLTRERTRYPLKALLRLYFSIMANLRLENEQCATKCYAQLKDVERQGWECQGWKRQGWGAVRVDIMQPRDTEKYNEETR